MPQAAAIVTVMTRATAGTRPKRIFWSNSTAGVRISARVIANERGIRMSRARYSTETTAIRIAMVLTLEEVGDACRLVIGALGFHGPTWSHNGGCKLS